MRTSNPTLSEKAFLEQRADSAENAMTINGTINKTGLLTLLIFAAAYFSWQSAISAQGNITIWIWGGAIGGFIVALVTVFKKKWAGITGPIYAVLEGLFLGAISALFEQQFAGIVFQAILLTFGTLAIMLITYRAGWIKVTQKFRSGMIMATGAIMLVYLISFVMQMFGAHMPFIHSGGTFGIIFSLVVVGIAALNLLLDFDFIERGANSNAPKYMEWYGAFSLMVTIIWLYLEILRLLSKIRR